MQSREYWENVRQQLHKQQEKLHQQHKNNQDNAYQPPVGYQGMHQSLVQSRHQFDQDEVVSKFYTPPEYKPHTSTVDDNLEGIIAFTIGFVLGALVVAGAGILVFGVGS